MTDPTSSTCPRCGSSVSHTEAGGLCPRCLLAMNLRTRTMQTGEGAAATAPPSPAELAEKFPQFEILECLGRGGMGVVYKARQKTLDRTVAIKILAGEWQDDPGFSERFEKEAKLLARLNHPNIVTIHDFGNAGGLFHIVMEYIDGVNVRDLLRDGRLVPEQALAIVPPICDALQFAHDHGVVHRDIKPENILLDREGRVKIADFGIATIAGDAADRSGTPAYMAPEQSGHAAQIDHRADIYALGVVLYEMLTGERPEKDFQNPSSKVRMDVKIDEVVLRALERNPEMRFQSAGEFKTVVETVAPGSLPGTAAENRAPLMPPRDRAPDAPQQASALLPKLALTTLLLGVVGTPLLLSFARRDEGVVLFGGLCLAASLVFAIMCWRTRIGRTILGLWAVLFLMVLGYLAVGLFSVKNAREAAIREMDNKERQADLLAQMERGAAEAREASPAPAVEAPAASAVPAEEHLLPLDLESALKSYADLRDRLREAELQLHLASGDDGDRRERERLVAVLRQRIEEEQAAIEALQKKSRALQR